MNNKVRTAAPQLVLVDGSSYLYRAFHAMPDLRADPDDRSSQPTGAIRGMVGMLQALRNDYPDATHLACVWVLVAGVGLAPLVANVLAFAVAFVVSYRGHARLTFHAAGARGWPSLWRFLAVASSAFTANELLYWLALERLHWHYFWGQAGILLLVAAGTFVCSKFWAFRPRSRG